MNLFEHISGNRFKVSEINLDADSSQFDISKIEEQHAFQYYKEKLLPEDVQAFNLEVQHRAKRELEIEPAVTTVKIVLDNMRKTYHGKARGITGAQIEYHSVIGKTQPMGEIAFTLRISREKVGVVTLRYWHTFGQLELKKDLTEGIDSLPKGWGNISKKEEDEAFHVIKTKWVPEFVAKWNKFHPVHKVTVEGILKTLKKTRHDGLQVPDDVKKYNRSDIIHYTAPLPDRHGTVAFMIHRFINFSSLHSKIPNGTLMAGYWSGTSLLQEPVYDV